MADNLIFPIGFDLEKAVNDAGKEWDGKYADKLEKLIAKRPVNVKLKLDVSKLDQLDRVKQRLASIKLEPITPETKSAIKQLSAELTTLAKALEQVQKFSAARASADPNAVRAARINEINTRAEAKAKVEAQKAAANAALAEQRLAAARLSAARAAKVTESANKSASKSYDTMGGAIERAARRLVAYWSVRSVGNFLTKVREVTAEFELQRVSLGAIIQDQQRANQLFEEIKTFALKSPVKILDLTKYTKQLSAYKIGVDELFDTTKRLTDISVGLGVSMDRIVLMYGQIRATGYLRASEVRQATEAGIPLVEELAKKLSKANGELVTAADVMEMISKRAISFDMVKDVFTDMTSAGGIFYNMQEKQGNTLYGMWQKLGDAAAMMYDQIGNTSSVNEGMKMAIQTLRYLMLHWKQVGLVVGGVSTYLVANFIATKNATIATAAASTANLQHVASLNAKLNALRLEQMNLKSVSLAQRLKTAATITGTKAEKASAMSAALTQRLNTAATISATKAQIAAATSTNAFSKALYGLKAALLSNPLTALAVALTTIIALLMQSESELDKLNSKLQDIDRDYDASGKKSVDRFKELVKAVEENVDGSKAQKEALDELDRTYGKILGSEALELDSLKALGGQYSELIDLIEAYNAKKRGEEKETAIKSSYATILDEEKDDLMDYLNQAGMSSEKQAEFIQAINDKMLDGKGAITATNEAFNEFADDISQLDEAGNILNVLNFDKLADAWGVGFRQLGGLFGGQGMDYLYNYARALEGQNKALEDNEKQTRLAADAMGVYSTSVDGLNKSFANLDWSSTEALYDSLQDYNSKHPENMISVPISLSFEPEKAETEYDKLLETSNMKIYAIFSVLQEIATKEGQTIPEEFYKQAKSVVEGNKDFSFIDWAKLEEQFKNSPKALAAIRAIKQLYESIAPSDDTIRMFNRKFMTLADNMDVSLDKMQKYVMKSGDNLGEHRKKLSDEVTNLLKQIARLEWTKKMLSMFGLPADAVEEKIQESQKTLKLLQSMIADIPDIEGIGKEKKSDPRLGILQEMVSTLKQVNKEYDDLQKKEGSTKALKDTQKVYEATFKNMQKLAKQYKFELPRFGVPTDTASLTKYLEAIKDAMAKLPKSQKAVLSLQVDIAKLDTDAKQKQIEEELKRLAEQVSRTKTAKEFYDKILGTTGDVELAASVSMSIYGDASTDVQGQMAEYISGLFGQVDVEVPLNVISESGNIDYTAMEKFVRENKKILGDSYKELLKIAQDGQRDLAKTYEGYLKDLEVAKTYADKRIELARDTANKIAEIEKSGLPQEEKERLIAGYNERESREASKLAYENFKNSALYVQVFEDLDNASKIALVNMRDRLVALKDEWKNLDPQQVKEQVKELTKRIEELDKQIQGRNPFESIAKSLGDLRKMLKSGRTKEGDAQKAFDAEKASAEAEAKMLADEKAYELAVKTYGAESEQAKAAKKTADASKKAYENAAKLADQTAYAAKEWKEVEDAINGANPKIDFYQQQVNDALGGIREMMESFGADEDTLQFFDDIVGGLNKIADAGQDAALAAGAFMTGNIFLGITKSISAIGGLVSGITDLVYAGRVRRANKEIKEQQEILDQLEYSYSRLEKSMEKAFGSDYIKDYQSQMQNLAAQIEAKQKQLEAERSKGKKKSEDDIKKRKEEIRDLNDMLNDMKGKVAEYFAGTDLTSAAREFAKSWLDAKLSFSDTTEAIEDKFKDMIKNMIVEQGLALVIQNALKPFFDYLNKASEDGVLSLDEMAAGVELLKKGMDNANNGAEVYYSTMEQAGIDLKSLYDKSADGYTGIAKDIAGATSEEINYAASIGNTIMYHTAYIPQIYAQLVAMAGGNVATPSITAQNAGWTDWQQQAMDAYTAIQRNTADTVVECRRSAQACEDVVAKLNSVIKYDGGTAKVYVRM